MGWEFTIRKSDEVRVYHEKKSDGVRVHFEKQRWGEFSMRKRAKGREFTMRKKGDGGENSPWEKERLVRVCHERKSEGVRVYYEKE